MNEFHRSASAGMAAAVTEAAKGPSQWTDNVARVYEVIRRHPEVTFTYPRISGSREFSASWPVAPGDEGSEIKSFQTVNLGELATILEREFPESKNADPE